MSKNSPLCELVDAPSLTSMKDFVGQKRNTFYFCFVELDQAEFGPTVAVPCLHRPGILPITVHVFFGIC